MANLRLNSAIRNGHSRQGEKRPHPLKWKSHNIFFLIHKSFVPGLDA